MNTSLTVVEAARLHDLENTIRTGLRTFVEVGSALAQIREGRLYRERFSTFEDYCREEYQISRPRAYELMNAAEVVGNLSAIADKGEGVGVAPLPATESQARPLSALEPEQQREVWKEVVDTAPEGKVTAAHVAKTVERVTRPLLAVPAKPAGVIPINRRVDSLETLDADEEKEFSSIVEQTVNAARSEFRHSEDGRLAFYIEKLPHVPMGIGEKAFADLHISALEILRIHAAFINRAIAQREKLNATA